MALKNHGLITILTFHVFYSAQDVDVKMDYRDYSPVKGTLLEKQNKFPRYDMKCRGRHDTT